MYFSQKLVSFYLRSYVSGGKGYSLIQKDYFDIENILPKIQKYIFRKSKEVLIFQVMYLVVRATLLYRKITFDFENILLKIQKYIFRKSQEVLIFEVIYLVVRATLLYRKITLTLRTFCLKFKIIFFAKVRRFLSSK